MYYVCIPRSFGILGPNSRLDLTTNPPTILAFEYALESLPQGQDLISSGSSEDYLVSDRLARVLLREGFRGYRLGNAMISGAAIYSDAMQQHLDIIGQYSWLKVVARNYEEDFSVVRSRLVVSDRARRLLGEFNMLGCRFVKTMDYDFDGTSHVDELRRQTSERLQRMDPSDFAGIT